VYYLYLIYIFTLDFPWLGKCCVLFILDLYIYFRFPLARFKWSYLLKLVRPPLQYDTLYDLMFFVVTKYTTFILLFRCHPEIDFDIGQREGRYCVHKTD
jgi:hypothetical protein